MSVECCVTHQVRGLLKSDVRTDERILRWFEPSEALAPYVQRIWSAQWNVPVGEFRIQPILPYPCANLVVSGGRATLFGVATRAALQRLEGSGSAFGAKLRPGALRALGVERPFAIRNKSIIADSLLSVEPSNWELDDPEIAVREIEVYLGRQNPKHDAVSHKADEIVQAAETHRSILAVSDLAEAVSLSARSLQDICRRTLGVSPKWLIRCFRLQEALARLDTGADPNLSALALDLGYFDQAHFTRDFKMITGVSPSRYRVAKRGPQRVSTSRASS